MKSILGNQKYIAITPMENIERIVSFRKILWVIYAYPNGVCLRFVVGIFHLRGSFKPKDDLRLNFTSRLQEEGVIRAERRRF